MALVSDMVFSALILASGLLTVSTIGFAVAWIRARERAIRAEQHAAPAPGLGGDARVDRLEQAVEAMVVEVERMAEGQRFVSKVLAERAAPERGVSASPARATTAP